MDGKELEVMPTAWVSAQWLSTTSRVDIWQCLETVLCLGEGGDVDAYTDTLSLEASLLSIEVTALSRLGRPSGS